MHKRRLLELYGTLDVKILTYKSGHFQDFLKSLEKARGPLLTLFCLLKYCLVKTWYDFYEKATCSCQHGNFAPVFNDLKYLQWLLTKYSVWHLALCLKFLSSQSNFYIKRVGHTAWGSCFYSSPDASWGQEAINMLNCDVFYSGHWM